METVVLRLNEGTVSICNTCKCLLDAQVDPTTSSDYEQMRKHIEQAESCLKESKTMIEEKRKYLEQCIERLIKEKGNAEQQNKEKCNASDKSQEIERQRARENTGKGVTIGGAVVAAIPVIGWIPGEKSSLIHYYFLSQPSLIGNTCLYIHFCNSVIMYLAARFAAVSK